MEWSDSGRCVSGTGSYNNVVMMPCDPWDESQMVELGQIGDSGDRDGSEGESLELPNAQSTEIWPLSVSQWRKRAARQRTKELGEARAEVGKMLEEIRELNTSGELGRARGRGSRRAAVFYLDKGSEPLAYLRWWLYAWRLAGLDTADQALDLVLFTHPASVSRLPAECSNITAEFEPEAAGPGRCLYRALVPLSERSSKYDGYLNSHYFGDAESSGFLLRYRILIRTDLDTFPTPALIDYWPRDIIAKTHAVTNHYLQSIMDAVVATSAAAGGVYGYGCSLSLGWKYFSGFKKPSLTSPPRYRAPRHGDGVQADGGPGQVHQGAHVRAGHHLPLRQLHPGAAQLRVGPRYLRRQLYALEMAMNALWTQREYEANM